MSNATLRPITVQYPTQELLANCYMPFIKSGGVFLPMPNESHDIQVGASMILMIVLPGETSKKPIMGKVAWITPPHSSSGAMEGVGVAFDDNPANVKVKNEIEGMLTGKKAPNSMTM